MLKETASLSKQGGRKNNQDSLGFELNESGGCWVVADGLGGHAGGETASRMAVEKTLELFHAKSPGNSEFIANCFDTVQTVLQKKASEEFDLSGMRTTMTVLVSEGDAAVWGHIGDSRLYWFRQGFVMQQTRDHSVPQMLVDAGKLTLEGIRGHEDQNRLTRAMGQEGAIRPTILLEPLQIEDGDAALLCSDGLWEYVLEKEMEEDFSSSRTADEWLKSMEKRVLARATGQHDNYTAIAVRFSRSN